MNRSQKTECAGLSGGNRKRAHMRNRFKLRSYNLNGPPSLPSSGVTSLDTTDRGSIRWGSLFGFVDIDKLTLAHVNMENKHCDHLEFPFVYNFDY